MKVKDLKFKNWGNGGGDILIGVKLADGSKITVLDRQTGYSHGGRDTETGYRDKDGNFYLVSGMFDIREYPELILEEAINKIKALSNV